ncbi:MAG: PAS domain-containing sensor histidine kinase [Prolixibacteraceae bacterium]|nr:PAS domain-containing sensor histidine kinase [Prolixibacteraceae bacterium]
MGYFLYIIILKIRRQANLTILDERNQLKTMINNIPDHIFIKDTKSRFLILNNNTIKYMQGKSEKEFLYKTDFDFHPKEKAEKYFRQEQEIISNGIPIINEESRRNINGQEMVMSTTKCPIINLKGETIGLIGIVRDITYQKIAELEIIKQSEELRNYNFLLNEKNLLLEERQQQIEKQAEKLTLANGQLSLLNATKDRFFSIIAHDLRNPFNNILGFTEILNDNDTNINDEEKKEITKQLFLSASNTYELLENLLEWSRTQSNRITFKSQQVDLENICQEVIDSLIYNSKNIKIKYLPTEKIELVVDSNMFKTILRNIISNAIKFSHKNGLINIDALKNSEKVTITISDNGIGIEKENLSKLFDLTQKLSTIGTAQEKGTGLGLIICKEFVEKHGGEIWVESEVGNGSDFKFTIPL